MKRETISSLCAALGMVILILDSKTALRGTAEGVELCVKSLIPSLFPFFVCSSCLTSGLSGKSVPMLRWIGKLYRIPKGSESVLAVGILGGYPVGAQSVFQAYRQGAISRKTAERMIAFCNNAGPSFIFGIAAPFFSQPYIGWILWLLQLVSTLIVAWIIPCESLSLGVVSKEGNAISPVLEKSLRAMALVCGWVILFRLILSFLNRWVLWLLPSGIQVLAAGLLELANGCLLLREVQSEGLRFIIASAMLSFGGFCVCFQTRSVTGDLSMGSYFPGKCLQSIICVLLSMGSQFLFPAQERYYLPAPLPGVIVLFMGIFIASFRIRKKRGSNPAMVGV